MISITRRDFLKYVNLILSTLAGIELPKSTESKKEYTVFMPIIAGGQAEIPESGEAVVDGTVVDDSFITFDDTMVFL